MRLSVLSLLSIINSRSAASTDGAGEFVTVLTDETFETFVSGPDSANAVLFVSSWCGVCKAILPLWSEAAKLVRATQDPSSSLGAGGKINFAVIDAQKYEKIAEEYSIQGFPTAKLFIDDEVFSYVHESPFVPLTASLFVNWVNLHTNRRNMVETEAQLAEFLKEKHLVVIGLFDESADSKNARTALLHSSMHFDDVFFVEILNKPELGKVIARTVGGPEIKNLPTIVMVYDHDDRFGNFTGPFDQEHIDAFIRGRRLLTVNVFQPGTIEYILDAGLPMLFLVSPQGVDDADAKNIFKQVAHKFLGQVVAVTVGSMQSFEQKLGEVLDTREARYPVVRILNSPPSNHHDHDPVTQSQSIIRHGLKYKPVVDEETLTVGGIEKFISGFTRGELKPYLRSEPEPENFKDSFIPGSLLVNAVATNFDKLVVQDARRDLLVVYHAPWCGFCRKLMPTLRELGTKLAHAGSSLKVVKIDATRNEIPNVNVRGYPTIVLYNAVDSPQPIDKRKSVVYDGDRSLDDFVTFLRTHASNKFSDEAPKASQVQSELRYAFEEL